MQLLTAQTRLRDWLDGKHDAYLAGHCWLAFHVRDEVAGFVLWGSLGEREFEALREALPMYDSPLTHRMPRYVDLRRLEAVDHAALTRFAGYFERHAEQLGGLVSRAAVVHSGGLGLALSAGFPSLTTIPYELARFTAPAEAFAWLGVRANHRLEAELEAAQARTVGVTPVVRDIRNYCTSNVRTAELAAAASELGLSSRSLQRKLRDDGTSFQHELNAARVETAKRLLASTDSPISTIAENIGCTAAQLGALFRRATGQTPRQWREANS